MAILHDHLELLDALKDDLVQKKHADVENRVLNDPGFYFY
jgi:hypothetical protein